MAFQCFSYNTFSHFFGYLSSQLFVCQGEMDSQLELIRMGLAGTQGPNEAEPPPSSTQMVCVKKEPLAGVMRVDDPVASLDLEDEDGGVGVGEKRRFPDTCDVEGGEAAGQGLRGQGGCAGDEKLEKKSRNDAKNKQGGFEGKRKEAVEKIQKRPSSEDSNEAHKQDQGEEVVSSRAKGEAGKRKRNHSLTKEAGTAGKAQRGA